VHYFAKRELFIAHTLARHFWWFKACLFEEEVPEKVLVILEH